MQRRKFLKYSSLAGGGLFANSFLAGWMLSNTSCKKDHHRGLMSKPVWIKETDFGQALQLPAEVGSQTSLTAQTTSMNLNQSTKEVLGYQANQMLGPTIRVQKGDQVNIVVHNQLAEVTNIHWHGLKIPAEMDGHPVQLIQPKQQFNYRFNVQQRVGLCWYHPHPHHLTAKQITKGLAGLFIVNDAEESSLQLPAGKYELPIVIQDKRFQADSISYNPSASEMMSGFLGDTICVNGVVGATHSIDSKFYRLRIVNASTARIYNIALSDGAQFYLIGNDGGLLQSTISLKEILLAPGERIDLLIDFSKYALNSEVFLVSNQFDGGDAQGKQAFKLLKFIVKNKVQESFTVPTTLSNLMLPSAASQKNRVFDISNAMEHHGYPMNTGMPMKHRINGKLFDLDRVDEVVNANSLETWVFDNSKGDELHPMHIHGVFFVPLKREGGRNKLIESEKGWKDTILVNPGEKVSVLVPFENLKGKFVFHCHNLEHEDDGMMLQYQLI